MANKRKEVESQLKDSYSMIVTALNLSLFQNSVSMSALGDVDSGVVFDTYFKPYYKFSKLCTTSTPCDRVMKYQDGSPWVNDQLTSAAGFLQNGSLLWLSTQSCTSEYGCVTVWVDLNGSKGPNIPGKDAFYFAAQDDGRLRVPGMLPSQNSSNLTDAINDCKRSNGAALGGFSCTAWIMSNNWRIPDDYPWL